MKNEKVDVVIVGAGASGSVFANVLTKAGKKLLKSQHIGPSDQAIYNGFVKPTELRHDAAIYGNALSGHE